MACKSKFYVICLKSLGEWIEGSCAPWVIWWHKKEYDSYHHLIWWFSICSLIRFIQKNANVHEFMWNIPFLLRHSVARLLDIFFRYFVSLLKMLRVVKIVMNKKKIGKFFFMEFTCALFYESMTSFIQFFSAMLCTFRTNSVCHVCLKCRSIQIIIILSHQNLKDMYTMWQKLIQSEQMCVVNFHRIALASREEKKLIWIWIQREMLIPMNFKWVPRKPYVRMENLSGCKWNDTSGYKWSNIPATNE